MSNVIITNGSGTGKFAAGTFNIAFQGAGYFSTLYTDAAATTSVTTITISDTTESYTHYVKNTGAVITAKLVDASDNPVAVTSDVYVRRSNAGGTLFYGSADKFAGTELAPTSEATISNVPYDGTDAQTIYFTIDTTSLGAANYRLVTGEDATKSILVSAATGEVSFIVEEIARSHTFDIYDANSPISSVISQAGDGTDGYQGVPSGTLSITE